MQLLLSNTDEEIMTTLSQMVDLLKCVVVQEAKHVILGSEFTGLWPLIGFYYIHIFW